MKIDFVKSIISIAVSSLIAYGFYVFYTQENKDILAIGSFIFLSITLLFTLGIRFNLPRTSSLIRTVSILFFVIALISNLVFHFVNFKSESYIIVIGILLLVYGLIVYSLSKLRQ